MADAFTGNLRGAGPATVALPFAVRKDNASQTVLVSFADKTEPMAFNHFATGAYMLPRFNTGLIIASSKMKRGYLFEIVDLDTKALERQFEVKPALTFGNGNGHGTPAPVPTRAGRPEEID